MRQAALAAVLSIAIAGHAHAVTYLAVDIPKYVTREAPTSFVVTARSENGTRLSGYRGTVHFTGDGTVDLPGDYTFTEADAGQRAFTAVFHRGFTHSFTVSDDGDGSGYGEVFVECPDITLSATWDHPMCPNPGATVTLSAFTNATTPQFLWQKIPGGSPELNQTGQTVVVSVGGKWALSVTDAATGCYKAILVEVPFERGPDVDAPAESYGDFTASVANAAGGPYIDFEWFVTWGTIVSGQGTDTIAIHPTTTSSVDLRLNVTRASTNCRVASFASTRIVPVPLSAAITADSEVCPNATGVASVPDSGAGTTYEWSIQNGQIVSGQGTPQITFQAHSAGVVELQAWVQRFGHGLTGTADVRVGPAAVVVSPDVNVCRGTSATIDATLAGTPPFRVVWSDGVEQTGIMTGTTTRSLSPDESAAYSIVSVTDALCTGTSTGAAFVSVMDEPEILAQPASRTIASGTTATLFVDAAGASDYWWYQGPSGDRSRFAGRGLPTFVTPTLTKTTSYWVEVINDCGARESATATVTVATTHKRRAVRR